ncbi:hypothetical protein [Brucella haematophila]|nr:hypothetical protein [Brucella haematophila]
MLKTDLPDDAGSYRIHTQADFQYSASLDWAYRCSMGLLKYPLNEAISYQLVSMSSASQADRAGPIEYRPDVLCFRNTHEWYLGQTTAYISELQEAPTPLIAWLCRYMVKGHAVAVHEVTDLPRTELAIQVEFLRQSNKSVLSVPVFHDDRLCGIIGFDTTVANNIWPTYEVSALHVIDVDRRKIDKWQVRMRSIDSSWPVSRSYRKQLRERMGI